MARTIEQRLEALSRAVWNGSSNPTLIKRAQRLAADMRAEVPAAGPLADRLAVALTRRGESLGNRYDRVYAILHEWRVLPKRSV